MNFGEFINASFTKAGIEVDNPALKDLVTKVATFEIGDDLVKKFNESYLTMDAAKHNPELKKHFYAPALNGVDTEIQNILNEFGYGDDVKSEITAEVNTYKKVKTLAGKIKELEGKKDGASKGEKAELSKQIEELNNQIKVEKQTAQKAIAEKESEFNSKLEDLYLTQMLSGYTYSSDLAKEEDFMLPKSKLRKELSERKLKAVLDGKNFKLETESGTDYFENNSKVDYKGFVEKVLANNKLLKVTEQTPANPANPQIVQTQNTKLMSGAAQYDQMIAEASGQK